MCSRIERLPSSWRYADGSPRLGHWREHAGCSAAHGAAAIISGSVATPASTRSARRGQSMSRLAGPEKTTAFLSASPVTWHHGPIHKTIADQDSAIGRNEEKCTTSGRGWITSGRCLPALRFELRYGRCIRWAETLAPDFLKGLPLSQRRDGLRDADRALVARAIVSCWQGCNPESSQGALDLLCEICGFIDPHEIFVSQTRISGNGSARHLPGPDANISEASAPHSATRFPRLATDDPDDGADISA